MSKVSSCFLAIVAVAGLGLSGCSSIFMPYSSKFSCKNKDHGKCVHPQSAHDESKAASGEINWSAANNSAAQQVGLPGGAGKTSKEHGVRSSRYNASAAADATDPAFASYRSAVYGQMAGLLQQPSPPMVRAATTVRTLILPYTDRNRPDRLYMPRYVYSVVDKPEFVVGQYLVAPSYDTSTGIFEQSAKSGNQAGGSK
jgi:conjugal transfer pilus assembly protein TraV